MDFEEQDEVLEKQEAIVTQLDEPTTSKLALLKNLKLNIVGPETGNKYHFSGAGSVVDVDNRDAPKMLEIGLGRKPCCSGTPSTPYFELVR